MNDVKPIQAVKHEIACHEQPQMRFDAFGPSALSDTELIALLLQNGLKTPAVVALASAVIAEAGSIAGLATWTVEDYRRVRGIGAAKARQMAAMLEVGRRMMLQAADALPLLNRPELVSDYMKPVASGLEIEKFWVLCLNRKNRLIKRVEITVGTATSSLAHPREVFRAAIRYGATGVICCHNHPSGDPAPSAADSQLTRLLREAARTVDIELLDHVVLGRVATDPRNVGWYSFREGGVL